MKRIIRTIIATATLIVLGASVSLANLQPNQSDRWNVDSSGTWRLSNESQTGFVLDSWFQDLDGEWYMLGSDNNGAMYSGLITDNSTGKSYYMNVNHDGYFGKLVSIDGTYNVNGTNVYLTFNQSHDGTFGAITGGLDALRNTGVNERSLNRIPVESATVPTTELEPTEAYDPVPSGNGLTGDPLLDAMIGGGGTINEWDGSDAGGLGGADVSDIRVH